jgi:hypothetical protein
MSSFGSSKRYIPLPDILVCRISDKLSVRRIGLDVISVETISSVYQEFILPETNER